MGAPLTEKILRLRKDGERLRTVCAGGMSTRIGRGRLVGKTWNPSAEDIAIISMHPAICSPGGSSSIIIGISSKRPKTPMRALYIVQMQTEYKPFGHFNRTFNVRS